VVPDATAASCSLTSRGVRSFRHIAAPLRLFCGPDSLDQLGRELSRLGCRRAVVVCGSSLAGDGVSLDLVRRSAGDRCVDVYAGVKAHSPLPAVEEAARAIERKQADAVIALGGGSAIVTARAASILLAERADARELCTARDAAGVLRSPRLLAPKLPQLAVPTTPTTAIVKAGSAVLEPAEGRRLALFDPKTRAQAVFVHPTLIATPPRPLVTSASLNTVAMALEGLMSHTGDPIADGLLMHALRLLTSHLQHAGDDEADMRGDLLIAAIMVGQATDQTGAGIAIPLGHAISARFHVDNGLANAIVMPHVLRFNAGASPDGLSRIAQALGVGAADGRPPLERIIAAIEEPARRLQLPRRLRDVGVTRESLAHLAAVSMEDWFVRDNPRPVESATQLERILEDAW